MGRQRHIEKGLGMLEGPGRVQRRPGRAAAHCEGPGMSLEWWAGSGLHGAHCMGPGDVEPGLGACQKGRACPGGAGKVIGCSLGAGRIVGVWDVLGGLGARVGWVECPSKRGGAYPGRAEPVQ